MVKKLLIMTVVLLGISTGSVSAATLTKSECEAAGGTYSNDRGVKECVLPVTETDPSGNSGNAWEASGSSSQNQQGSIGASGTSETFEETTTTDSCTNPGGNSMQLTNPHCQL